VYPSGEFGDARRALAARQLLDVELADDGVAEEGDLAVLRDMKKRGNLDRLPDQLSDPGREGLRLLSATRRL
jgi:hypothetical protein